MLDVEIKGEGLHEEGKVLADRGNVIDLMAALKKSLGQTAPEPAQKKAAWASRRDRPNVDRGVDICSERAEEAAIGKTKDEFKTAFKAIKKPKRPDAVSGSNKDKLEKAVDAATTYAGVDDLDHVAAPGRSGKTRKRAASTA